MYQGLTVFCHGFFQASCKYIKVYFTGCMCKRKLLGLVWVSTKWVKFVRYLEKKKQREYNEAVHRIQGSL